jgi:hypothetical protein
MTPREIMLSVNEARHGDRTAERALVALHDLVLAFMNATMPEPSTKASKTWGGGESLRAMSPEQLQHFNRLALAVGL